ncbi:methyltransferase domain-containing protein [Tropicimonas isoalkanivorans]|uniref:Methyltransferase domain-containing protein n=1 Tax=Tropicimonas isoalkanivorans TaxID=441112 RepID=A0A1I1R916_9RHOB|nr:methyltransferase domain-containing protein [Tropicimonas isoalkanivorans]SFD26820.1 Methyltransferase domain-containing protein [Tropicimonas isoalkanivorans]
MNVAIKPLAKGIGSMVLPSWRSTHQQAGSITARHCYNLYFRHLGYLQPFLTSGPPPVMFELGPGSSLGVGIAAILTGVEEYFALDLQVHRDVTRDQTILQQLAEMLKTKAPFSTHDEWGNHLFPPIPPLPVWPNIEGHLTRTLDPDFIERIHEDLEDETQGKLRFLAPYDQKMDTIREAADWVMSQSVLEHVDRLNETYKAMAAWLKPGGHMTHLIDFSSHTLTKAWNGHWAVGDATWSLVRGKRPYLINRVSRSGHLDLMRKYGMEIVKEVKFTRNDGLDREQFRPAFRNMPEEDARTAMSFVIARKM